MELLENYFLRYRGDKNFKIIIYKFLNVKQI